MDDLTLRLKSFAYELGTLAAIAATGYIASPEFQELFMRHFGQFALAGIVLPIIVGVVKQVRNTLVANTVVGSSTRREYRI